MAGALSGAVIVWIFPEHRADQCCRDRTASAQRDSILDIAGGRGWLDLHERGRI